MKLNKLILIIFCIPLFSCSFFGGEKYFVLFESAPNILNEKILSMNFEIGKIIDKKLNSDKIVIVTIKIDKKYSELIKDNGVFYVDGGNLIYETVGDTHNLISPKSRILGFATKTEFLWFKTKYVLDDFSKIAIKKAQELYKEYNQ